MIDRIFYESMMFGELYKMQYCCWLLFISTQFSGILGFQHGIIQHLKLDSTTETLSCGMSDSFIMSLFEENMPLITMSEKGNAQLESNNFKKKTTRTIFDDNCSLSFVKQYGIRQKLFYLPNNSKDNFQLEHLNNLITVYQSMSETQMTSVTLCPNVSEIHRKENNLWIKDKGWIRNQSEFCINPLMGTMVNVSAFGIPPYILPLGSIHHLTGVDVEVMKIIASVMKFDFYIIWTNSWGQFDKEAGRWTGTLGIVSIVSL